MIGFLGDLIGSKTSSNLKNTLDTIFESKETCYQTYKYLSAICKQYRRLYEKDHYYDGSSDYNVMIKRPIDTSCLKFAIGNVDDLDSWPAIKKWRKP